MYICVHVFVCAGGGQQCPCGQSIGLLIERLQVQCPAAVAVVSLSKAAVHPAVLMGPGNSWGSKCHVSFNG